MILKPSLIVALLQRIGEITERVEGAHKSTGHDEGQL